MLFKRIVSIAIIIMIIALIPLPAFSESDIGTEQGRSLSESESEAGDRTVALPEIDADSPDFPLEDNETLHPTSSPEDVESLATEDGHEDGDANGEAGLQESLPADDEETSDVDVEDGFEDGTKEPQWNSPSSTPDGEESLSAADEQEESTLTIVYWLEKVNILGDAGTDSSNYAFNKSVIKTDADGIVAGIAVTIGYGEANLIDISDLESINNAYYSHYSLGSATVLSEGATVVNVYFKRTVYTISFDLAPQASSGDERYYATMAWRTNIFDSIARQGLDTSGIEIDNRYSFTAKYGQDITDLWPSSYNSSFKQTYQQLNDGIWSTPTDHNNNFVGWTTQGDDSIFVTHCWVLADDIAPTNGTTRSFTANWSDSSDIQTVNYYFERLPDETGGVLYEDKYYILSSISQQYIGNDTGLNPKQIEGMISVNPGPQFGSTKSFYYDRLRYRVDFNVRGGNVALNDGIDYNNVMFGEDLGSYVPTSTPARTANGVEYIFMGWYYDAGCYFPYISGDTMPSGNTTLYARWASPDNSRKIEVTIKASDAIKPYDGRPLINLNIEVTGLPDGYYVDMASIKIGGTIAAPGIASNTIMTLPEDIIIRDLKGTDVTSEFIIKTERGRLTVTQLTDDARMKITIKANSATYSYNGSARRLAGYTEAWPNGNSYGAVLSGLRADTIRAVPGVTQMDATGTATVRLGGVNVTENYDIVREPGALTIKALKEDERIAIVVIPTSAAYSYDGTEKQVTGFTESWGTDNRYGAVLSGLSAEATRTEPGITAVNVIGRASVKLGGINVSSNYLVVRIPGTLKINDAIEEATIIDNYPPLATDETEDPLFYYILGYPDKTVRQNNHITRAEAATIFYRLLFNTYEDGHAHSPFIDVPYDAWFSLAVTTLSEMEIINGYEDGTFRPNKPITRAEFATIAARSDNLNPIDINIFNDVPLTHWASKYINSAYASGWLNDVNDTTFYPSHYITRAEAVESINSMLGRHPSRLPESYQNPYTDIDNTQWAFPHIMEASADYKHEYGNDAGLWAMPGNQDSSGDVQTVFR